MPRLPFSIATSRPIVPDATPIARQILERIEAVEMIDRYVRDQLRFGQSQIHGDAALAVRFQALPAPISDAAAHRAEVKVDGFAALIDLCRPRDVDAVAFEIIG